MPRVPPIYSDFFDGPLTEDVEELLARFQQADSVRFEAFSSIWRQMSFSDVFVGIQQGGEMKRFTRVTLNTAMKYFLPPYSYQIRVGGLYLMFGFYHTQLSDPPVKIRLALRDWAEVQRFLKDSVDSGHQDAVYIYQKLVAANAIHYAAMPHLLTFKKQRNPKKEPVCAEFLGRTTAVHDLLSADILEEVNNIHSLYEKLKEATVEVSRQVTVSQRDLPERLRSCMSEFISWQQKTFSQDHKDRRSTDDDDDDDDEEEEEDEEEEKPAEASRARVLSSIKQKSYKNFQEAPRSRRHRQAEKVEQVEEEVTPQQPRGPPSLRARTWQSLGKVEEGSRTKTWLLCAPEQQEKEPVRRRRTKQAAPFRPWQE